MPNITVGAITSTNPGLWVNTCSLDDPNPMYQIATDSPSSDGWVAVNQFCSLLSLHWLLEGRDTSPYGISNFSDEAKISLAEQLISFSSLTAQVNLAVNQLPGKEQTWDQVVKGMVEIDTGYPIGTGIWAGNDEHVYGIHLISPTEYKLYDSNNGQNQILKREKFPKEMGTRPFTLKVFVKKEL